MDSVPATLQRLDNATLGDRASAALLEHIRARRLQPGMVLPSEARLGELLGVSRPVVREALRNLRGLGVVEIFNGRGAVVRELSPASLEVFFAHALQTVDNSLLELMELRLGLECEAAALAAERHTADDAASMRALIGDMRVAQGDAERYSRLDAQLHVAISRASGNQLYLHMIRSIRTAMRDASLAGMRLRLSREEVAAVQHMHESVVDRILARNRAGAFREMQRHMQMATDALRSPAP